MAAHAAVDDALGLVRLAPHIDVVATTRTFDDSRGLPAPFGGSRNFPRSVADRLGLKPRLCLWERAGGDTPQTLVNEFCERIARRDARMVLLAGGEAISTVRHLLKQGIRLDWNESPAGDVEDHGPAVGSLITEYNRKHGLLGAPLTYGLLENARRATLGFTREDYMLQMGRLLAPFTKVAAANPYSAFVQTEQAPEQIATGSTRNRLVCDPYLLSMVAKDQVNQGAALLLTSTRVASELGISSERWIYLHGYAQLAEREVMERQDLGASPAARMTAHAAIEQAGIDVTSCKYFDFYSCFPIAVSSIACDGLGLEFEDQRGLTVTGGLPYFGGPGNNYSMHAIAELLGRLRLDRQAYGFIGANGGYLSKHAAGIYSARPAPWHECSSTAMQDQIDALPAPSRAVRPQGPAVIESFTARYEGGQPTAFIAAARMVDDGTRCLATVEGNGALIAALLHGEPIGRRIEVSCQSGGVNTIDQQEVT